MPAARVAPQSYPYHHPPFPDPFRTPRVCSPENRTRARDLPHTIPH